MQAPCHLNPHDRTELPGFVWDKGNNRGHGEETKEEPEPIAAESVTTGDRGNDSLTIDYTAERAEMDSAPTGTTETTTAK